MDMDVISGVNRTTESASPDVTRVDAGKAVAVQKTTAAPSNVTGQTTGQTSGQESDAKQGMPFDGKDPAKSTIDSAVSSANNRMVIPDASTRMMRQPSECRSKCLTKQAIS